MQGLQEPAAGKARDAVARFGWAGWLTPPSSSADTGAADQTLRRAQCHLSMLHRISDVSPTVAAVLPGVLYHHERWDGGGYPEGLREEQIPLIGRLLGVADFYDAVTSARPYRPAIPPVEAIAMIADGAGTHFDPAIVEVVMRLHRRGDLLPSNWQALRPMRHSGLPAPVPVRR